MAHATRATQARPDPVFDPRTAAGPRGIAVAAPGVRMAGPVPPVAASSPPVQAQGRDATPGLTPSAPRSVPTSRAAVLPGPLMSALESLSGLALDDVKVHYASSSPGQINALAYAQGREIHLAPGQERHLPHEAWHVVQQAQGRVRPTLQARGLGINDDQTLEQEADLMGGKALADSTMAGGVAPARDGQVAAEAGPLPQPRPVGVRVAQCRRASRDEPDWISSDSGGTILIGEKGLYAKRELVTEGRKKLAGVGTQGSYITLKTDGKEYTHEGQTLTKVVPKWVDHANMGDHEGVSNANDDEGLDSTGVASKDADDIALWADCGRSSGAVTGSIDQSNRDRQAVYHKSGVETLTSGRLDPGQHKAAKNSVGRMANAIYFELMASFIKDPANFAYLKAGTHYSEKWLSYFYSGRNKYDFKVPSDGVEAQQFYGLLTNEGQQAFDKAAGINHYANPEIGESYAMGTGYNLPGFKEYKGKSTWNFHWAGVIMKDGSDNITLENYAVIAEGIDRFINRDWNFALYGTMQADDSGADQTFHHDHLASKTHGTKATSIAVRTNK